MRENAEWLMGSINENALCAFCVITVAILKIPKYPSPINFALFSSPLLCYRPTPVYQIQTEHHPTITGLPPQPISTFDNPNTKSTKSNQFYTIL